MANDQRFQKDLKPIFLWLYRTLRLENHIDTGHFLQSDEERSNYVRDMLKNELASVFLLVWPIMEQKLFNGTATNNKDNNNNFWEFSKQNQALFCKLNMDEVAKYFHNRYKNDDERYQKLLADPQRVRGNSLFDRILRKNYCGNNGLTNREKLYLLLFVTYRYRNNIFHGSKEINVWNNYSTELSYCIDFMMALITAYIDKHPQMPSEVQRESKK